MSFYFGLVFDVEVPPEEKPKDEGRKFKRGSVCWYCGKATIGYYPVGMAEATCVACGCVCGFEVVNNNKLLVETSQVEMLI